MQQSVLAVGRISRTYVQAQQQSTLNVPIPSHPILVQSVRWGFVETGEVRMRKLGEPGGQPRSPLSIAFAVIAAGVAGSAVLTGIYTATGEKVP